MPQFQFNATTVEPSKGYEPLPEGWYNFMIEASDYLQTADGQGAYLKFNLKVIDGLYANQVVFVRLNVQNNDPKTVEIANAELSAICHVCGVLDMQATEQLHNIPFTAKAKVKPGDGNYGPSNNISSYSKHGTIDVATGRRVEAGQGVTHPAQQQPVNHTPPQNVPPQQAAPQQGNWGGQAQQAAPAQAAPAQAQQPAQQNWAPEGAQQAASQGGPDAGLPNTNIAQPQAQPQVQAQPQGNAAPQGGAPSWAQGN